MRMTIVILSCWLAACAGDDDGDGGGACERVWYVDEIQEGATAEIAGGQMILRAPTAQGREAIEAARLLPAGDFDLSVEVSSFTAGGEASFVGATLLHDDGAGEDYMSARLVTTGAAATAPRITANDPSTLTSGTLRIEKRGPEVTVTATTADATAGLTGAFAYDRLVLALHVGSTGDHVGAETSATIESVTVTAGAFEGDSFDCDSIVTNVDD